MKRAIVLLGIVVVGVPVIGQTEPLRLAAVGVAAASVSTTGVVQQVNQDEGKVKISHDAIPALDWPAMTMFFPVKDKAMLQGVGAGDKVRFELEKGPTGFVIKRMTKIAK